MKLTRTRLIMATALGVLVLVAAGCASQGDSNDTNGARPERGVVSEDNALETGQQQPGAGADVQGFEAAGNVAPPADDQFAALLDRKIVQNTTVDLKVEEVGRNFQDIISVAQVNGGFVASSSFSNIDDQQVADLTVRVPADRYQAVLQQIRDMGEVATEGSDSSDVTEEYTDLEARLRTLEATEQRYLELLAQAGNVNDILTVQDRLDGVRGQIEQLQGRINMLNNLTDLATITVHLRPLVAGADGGSGGGGPHPLEAASNAWEASLDALRGVAAAALVVAVFSWWLVPPLAGLGLGARWLLGRRPKPARSPAG